jgi:hypothetical protein
VRRDAPDGPVLGAVGVPDTGNAWTFVSTEVDDPGETFTLYLVFTNPDAGPTSNLFNLNFFEVVGDGIAGPPRPPICTGTVEFGAVDSGVSDRDAGNDYCLGETLDDGRDWANLGAFVDHVDTTTEQLVAAGVLSEQERAALVRAAARSGIGR